MRPMPVNDESGERNPPDDRPDGAASDEGAQPSSRSAGGRNRRVILEWRRDQPEEPPRGERRDEPLRDASQPADTRWR